MITLLLVTLPVEVIFLTILHGLGWLNLPFLFIAFSVVFFCCAVRFSYSHLASKNHSEHFYRFLHRLLLRKPSQTSSG